MFSAEHLGIPGLRHPAAPSVASRNDECPRFTATMLPQFHLRGSHTSAKLFCDRI
jgi:hypothetical protein